MMTAPGETEERLARMNILEDEINALSTRLDFLVDQFRQVLPGTAATWIRQEFARGIKDNAEQVQDLGVAGVKVIKSDMEQLIAGLPTLCTEMLHNPATWAHHSDELLSRPSVQRDFFFDRVFRDVISTAGAILERHSLLGNRGSHSYWQRVKGGWRYGMNSAASAFSPEVSEEYKEGLQRLRELTLIHAEERKCLAEVRAQSLWDSV